MDDKLEIGNDCYLEYYKSFGVSLCYMEHQADSWYSDTKTEVDIDKTTAIKIVKWLNEKYQLPNKE